MIGFFLKKNFYDGWTNIWYLLVPNFVINFFTIGSGFLLWQILFSKSAFAIPLFFLAFIILFALIMVLAMAFSENAVQIASFGAPKNSDYFKQIPVVAKDAFRYGALIGFLLVAGGIGIPIYTSVGGILGNALAVLMLCFLIVFFLSLQWFVPLRALLHDPFGKCLKKCFIVFFDNTGFSIFMFFYNIMLTMLSFMIFTVIPGTTGIILAQVNALRLRMYKYDWLDANPQYKNVKARKQIPWEDLIKNDRESLGPLSFKSFFMPWRDKE